MIESNRDEEVCRRCDVLDDEDHTYHLSKEEYFYKKKIAGSIWNSRVLIPSNCLLTLNVYAKKLVKNNSRPLLIGTTTEVGIEFVLYMVGMAKLLVLFLQFRKSGKRQSKILGKNGETRCWQCFGENLRRFMNSTFFNTDRSFTADSGLQSTKGV